MPYEIPRPRIRRNLYAIVAVAALAFALPPAAIACTMSTEGASQTFASQGDFSYYTLVNGSDFAHGSDGWSLTNATVTNKLVSLVWDGVTDSDALMIGHGGSAISPQICVSSAVPTFRFFSLGTRGFTQLNVQLLWKDAMGLQHVTPVGWVHGNASWQVSPPLKLGSALPLWMHASTQTVRVKFQPVGYGIWAIDGVYIDPYSRG